MWFCRLWQQQLALCLTKALRYLVEGYLEWTTVNHLATNHKGNCSRLRNCLFQTPSQQPPEHFYLEIKMHQRICASPAYPSSHKLSYTGFCLLPQSYHFSTPGYYIILISFRHLNA